MLRFSTMNWLLQAAIDDLDTGIMPEESLTEAELAYFNSSVAQNTQAAIPEKAPCSGESRRWKRKRDPEIPDHFREFDILCSVRNKGGHVKWAQE